VNSRDTTKLLSSLNSIEITPLDKKQPNLYAHTIIIDPIGQKFVKQLKGEKVPKALRQVIVHYKARAFSCISEIANRSADAFVFS